MRLLNSATRVWTVFWVCTIMTFRGSAIARLLMHTGYANIHSITVLKFFDGMFYIFFCVYTISQNKNVEGIRKKQSTYTNLC